MLSTSAANLVVKLANRRIKAHSSYGGLSERYLQVFVAILVTGLRRAAYLPSRYANSPVLFFKSFVIRLIFFKYVSFFRLSNDSLICLRIVADRKSTRLNSSHVAISYAVFC